LRRYLISTALLSILAVGLGFPLSSIFEKKIYDQKARLFSRPCAAPVVLVEIDQESIDFYNRELNISWPWPRSLYARAIDYLAAAGARAVAVDMVFSEPSPYAGEDEWLAASMQRSGNVFMPLFFTDNPTAATDLSRLALPAPPAIAKLPVKAGTGSLPVPQVLAALRGGGHAAENPDNDGVYRRLRHFIGVQGRVYPSLSLALAMYADPGLEMAKIPFAADGGLNLKFYTPGRFERCGISELIQSQVRSLQGQPPVIRREKFRGKIVLIGATATSLLDNRPSPVHAAGTGMELHATALGNFLRRDFLRVLPPWLQALLLLLAIALLNGLLSRISSIRGQVLTAAVAVVATASGGVVLFALDLDMNLLPISLGLLLTTANDVYGRYRRARREKKFIQDAFQNYLSDSLLAEIMKNPKGLNLGGEKKLVTVFFSDLAGFTSLSEKLAAEEVVGILNDYLERMTTVIMEGGGFVNKFEGDAIMAFWGAPLASAEQAAQAMRAALRCQDELLELNSDFARRGLPALGMRIGINSGEVIVGNIGSRKRFEYTVIGDAVNLASRLEGINKQYGTTVICGSLAGRMAAGRIVLRRLDRVRVKGKRNPEEIFEVVAGKAASGVGERLARFDAALQLYFAGDFAGAGEAFSSLEDDPPARIFAGRCRYLQEHPPVGWDGVWTFTEK
jgi:adenylate cyclase